MSTDYDNIAHNSNCFASMSTYHNNQTMLEKCNPLQVFKEIVNIKKTLKQKINLIEKSSDMFYAKLKKATTKNRKNYLHNKIKELKKLNILIFKTLAESTSNTNVTLNNLKVLTEQIDYQLTKVQMKKNPEHASWY